MTLPTTYAELNEFLQNDSFQGAINFHSFKENLGIFQVKRVCKSFLSGDCKNDRCRSAHPPDNVLKYFNWQQNVLLENLISLPFNSIFPSLNDIINHYLPHICNFFYSKCENDQCTFQHSDTLKNLHEELSKKAVEYVKDISEQVVDLKQIEEIFDLLKSYVLYYEKFRRSPCRSFYGYESKCSNPDCKFLHDKGLKALSQHFIQSLAHFSRSYPTQSIKLLSQLDRSVNMENSSQLWKRLGICNNIQNETQNVMWNNLFQNSVNTAENRFQFKFQLPQSPKPPQGAASWNEMTQGADELFQNASFSLPIIQSFTPSGRLILDESISVSNYRIRTANASLSGQLFESLSSNSLTIEIQDPENPTRTLTLTSIDSRPTKEFINHHLLPTNDSAVTPLFPVAKTVMASKTIPHSDKILQYLPKLQNITDHKAYKDSILMLQKVIDDPPKFLGRFYSLMVQCNLLPLNTHPDLNENEEITKAFISHHIIVHQSRNFKWAIRSFLDDAPLTRQNESKLLFLLQLFKSCEVFSDETLSDYKPGFVNHNQIALTQYQTDPFIKLPKLPKTERLFTILDVLISLVWIAASDDDISLVQSQVSHSSMTNSTNNSPTPASMGIRSTTNANIFIDPNDPSSDYVSSLELENGIVLYPSTFHPAAYLYYFEYPTTKTPTTTPSPLKFIVVMLMDGTVLVQNIPVSGVDYNFSQIYLPINARGTPKLSMYFNTNTEKHSKLLDIVTKRFEFFIQQYYSEFHDRGNDRVLRSAAEQYYVNPQEVFNFRLLPGERLLPAEIGIVSFSSFSISFVDSTLYTDVKYDCTPDEWRAIQNAIRFALLSHPDVNFQADAPFEFVLKGEETYSSDKLVRCFLDETHLSEQDLLGLIQRENIVGVHRLPISIIKRFQDWYNGKGFDYRALPPRKSSPSLGRDFALLYQIIRSFDKARKTYRKTHLYEIFRAIALLRQVFYRQPPSYDYLPASTFLSSYSASHPIWSHRKIYICHKKTTRIGQNFFKNGALSTREVFRNVMRLCINDQGSIDYLQAFPCPLCGNFDSHVSYDHDKFQFAQVFDYFWEKWEHIFLNLESRVDFTQAVSFTETGPQLSPLLQESWFKFHRAYVASSARLCKSCNNEFDKNHGGLTEYDYRLKWRLEKELVLDFYIKPACPPNLCKNPEIHLQLYPNCVDPECIKNLICTESHQVDDYKSIENCFNLKFKYHPEIKPIPLMENCTAPNCQLRHSNCMHTPSHKVEPCKHPLTCADAGHYCYKPCDPKDSKCKSFHLLKSKLVKDRSKKPCPLGIKCAAFFVGRCYYGIHKCESGKACLGFPTGRCAFDHPKLSKACPNGAECPKYPTRTCGFNHFCQHDSLYCTKSDCKSLHICHNTDFCRTSDCPHVHFLLNDEIKQLRPSSKSSIFILQFTSFSQLFSSEEMDSAQVKRALSSLQSLASLGLPSKFFLLKVDSWKKENDLHVDDLIDFSRKIIAPLETLSHLSGLDVILDLLLKRDLREMLPPLPCPLMLTTSLEIVKNGLENLQDLHSSVVDNSDPQKYLLKLNELSSALDNLTKLSTLSTCAREEIALKIIGQIKNDQEEQKRFKKAFSDLEKLQELSKLPFDLIPGDALELGEHLKILKPIYNIENPSNNINDTTTTTTTNDANMNNTLTQATSRPHLEIYCQYTSVQCVKSSLRGYLCGLLHVDIVPPEKKVQFPINLFQIPAHCKDGAFCSKANCNSNHMCNSQTNCREDNCQFLHDKLCPELEQNGACPGFTEDPPRHHQSCNFQHICTKPDCSSNPNRRTQTNLDATIDTVECKFIHLCEEEGCTEPKHYHSSSSKCFYSESSCPFLCMCIPHEYDYFGQDEELVRKFWGTNII